ncbi:MAG: protein kinase [Acidobacteriota bacterium]|nr:protein kinase [Acidobacteriota bacterium]
MTSQDWESLEAILDSALRHPGDDPEAWLRLECPAGEPREQALDLLSSGDLDFKCWAADAAANLICEAPNLEVPGRLGPYTILRHLATGGMGNVHEAEDPRLKRRVAIKVLHSAAIRGLNKEAEALAGLRHPNICRVFEVARTDGVDYLVMEMLDGVPLNERLRHGPLPLKEALAIGRALASALAEAHRVGIAHRDLKPANVLMTRHGPSLVDFGIADLATVANSVPAGTAPYMAPEQARGLCDTRSDIYSLGSVLREILGQQSVPAPVRDVIDACLRADPDERWQNAGDLARALEWLGEPFHVQSPVPWWRRPAVGLMVACALGAATVLGISTARYWIKPLPMVLVPLRGPRNTSLGGPSQVAISPDASSVAFVAPGKAGEMLIWIRKLGELEPEALAATVGASHPFWAPDGQSIGFFRERNLEILNLSTGALQTLTVLPRPPLGAAWGSGGRILYSMSSIHQDGTIYRISSSGGPIASVTTLNQAEQENQHRQPVFLPDGEHFLFLAASNLDVNVAGRPGSTYLAGLGDSSRTLLLRGALAVGASRDRIFYVRDRKLWSQPLNVRTGKWTAVPKVEASDVAWSQVSSSGMFLYAPTLKDNARALWISREGSTLSQVPVPEGGLLGVGVSPDGETAFVTRREDQSASVSLWVVNGNRVERIGSSVGSYVFPVWSGDGKWIYFGKGKGVWRQLPKAEAEPEQVLVEGNDNIVVSSFSPDGKYALGMAFDPALKRGYDIFRLDVKERTRRWWSATAASETMPAISPNGRWVAWLCEFPRPGRVCLSPAQDPKSITYVSTTSALEPRWSRDGKELYFIDGDNWLRSVHLQSSSGPPAAGITDRLFRMSAASLLGSSYGVSPGGKFLVREPYQAPEDPVLVWNPKLTAASTPGIATRQ